MKKIYEYSALILALLGMYNLFKLTISWTHGKQVNPSTVWLYGGATILVYLINKILEKQNRK
jgi:hypothetical protein